MSEITVYGAAWCGPCKQVKQFLTDKGIPFDYVDVDESPDELPEGYRSIPVIEVDGEYYVGYNKEALTKIANKNL